MKPVDRRCRLWFALPLAVALMLGGVPASAQQAAGQDAARTPEAGITTATPPAPSLSELPRAVWRDQKPIWRFPVEAAKGQHWKPALAVTLATTGLVFLDSHDTPYFRRTSSFGDFNRTVSGRNTALGMVAVPLSFYVAGRVRQDDDMAGTATLAGEAAADSLIVATVMKGVTWRLRPSDIQPTGDFGHTWYKSHGWLGQRSGFPSGHTIAAFSIATIFAERYRRHRWAPFVAYGLASLVGFSRITLQSHFPSDIFAGAVLGWSISHFVVLHDR